MAHPNPNIVTMIMFYPYPFLDAAIGFDKRLVVLDTDSVNDATLRCIAAGFDMTQYGDAAWSHLAKDRTQTLRGVLIT